MSKLLNDLVNKNADLCSYLERLLLISTRLGDKEIAEWCSRELQGYEKQENLPSYRIVTSLNIMLYGFKDGVQFADWPLMDSYLSQETWNKIKTIPLLENFKTIERRVNEGLGGTRELNMYASEIAQNTKELTTFGLGLQCSNVKQIIDVSQLEALVQSVRLRLINLLVAYGNRGVDIDSADVTHLKNNIKFDSIEVYNSIIANGDVYSVQQDKHKIFWKIFIPIITGIVSGVVVFIVTYFLTKQGLN